MKYNFLLPFTLMLFLSCFAYTQNGKLPPFAMMQSNGKTFKAQNLPMGKPIIIIYFSPGCDHCEVLMKSFFKQPAMFAKASVAMITYLPVHEVELFEKMFDVKKYANIYTGTEGNVFFVRDYYRLKEIPFVALYDKAGNFIKSYSRDIPLKELANRLVALN